MVRRPGERQRDQEDVTWRHEDGSGGKGDQLPRQPVQVGQGHPGPRQIPTVLYIGKTHSTSIQNETRFQNKREF